MSAPIALAPAHALSIRERCAGLLAVATATMLLTVTQARPHRIRRILAAPPAVRSCLRHGGHTADLLRAEQAYRIVTTVSLRCASGHGCLRRSLSIIVLCRMSGIHVTWRVGFRSPPPQCHAWIEAADEPVCEIADPRTIYMPIITI